MTEDFFRNLANCENYQDRRVLTAAGALIHLYHNSHSDILHREDPKQPAEANLVCDLAEYKHHRDSSVIMAACALVHLYHNSPPNMVHKQRREQPIHTDLHDWTECRNRCDFNVMKAAKTLIHLYRNSHPKTTKKRNAERPTEAIFKLKTSRHREPDSDEGLTEENDDDDIDTLSDDSKSEGYSRSN